MKSHEESSEWHKLYSSTFQTCNDATWCIHHFRGKVSEGTRQKKTFGMGQSEIERKKSIHSTQRVVVVVMMVALKQYHCYNNAMICIVVVVPSSVLLFVGDCSDQIDLQKNPAVLFNATLSISTIVNWKYVTLFSSDTGKLKATGSTIEQDGEWEWGRDEETKRASDKWKRKRCYIIICGSVLKRLKLQQYA